MTTKYKVVLADCPWPFRVWSRATGHGRSAESHYPTMSLKQLCALPVKDIVDKDSALFLWAVWPSIFEYVPPLLAAWGYTYKTLAFEWIKVNKRGKGVHIGMGYYTRANPEPCLLAVRGRMPVAVHGERNLIITDEDTGAPYSLPDFDGSDAAYKEVVGTPLLAKIGRHSEKPVDQYAKIQRLYPNGPYLELFARTRRPGWAAWGNEIDSDIGIVL